MEIWKKRKPKDNLKEILELKITITEMKNSLEEFEGRFKKEEERVREIEDNISEIIDFEEQKEKRRQLDGM